MSSIIDIVPPLELCKQIPGGEFADCALWFVCQSDDDGGERIDIIPREILEWLEYNMGGKPHTLYPAPTLQEILFEIKNLGGRCPSASLLQNRWAVDCLDEKKYWMDNVVEQDDPDNPAKAALELWLNLKGIEA